MVMEAVLLLVPVTIYSFFFGINMISDHLRPGGQLDVAVVAFLSLLSLVVGWMLTLRFLIKGSQSLQKSHIFWFIVASFGPIIVIISGIIAMFNPQSLLSIFVLGAPAAMVYIHLLLERLLRKNTVV